MDYALFKGRENLRREEMKRTWHLQGLVGKRTFEAKEWKSKGRKLRMRSPDSKCRQRAGAGQQARGVKELSRRGVSKMSKRR